jgi:hypothetical protein
MLIFSIVDVWTMMVNNERGKDVWFFDMIYGMFSIVIPMAYYIGMGVSSSFRFIGYEFAMILIYTIVYGIIIIIIIISSIVGLICCIMKTINVVTERENNIKDISNSTNIEIPLDSSLILYREVSTEN